jgi:ACT domain-containing protein
MKKLIITVIGHDQVGIIAKVCTYLAENNVNIIDISQTITGGYFNMMMVAEADLQGPEYLRVSGELATLGSTMGLQIQTQNADIFNMMHRI